MPETRFKAVCKEKGLTAEMIEKKTGIKKKTIYSYFNGSRCPSSVSRKKIRENLDIDTSKVFD